MRVKKEQFNELKDGVYWYSVSEFQNYVKEQLINEEQQELRKTILNDLNTVNENVHCIYLEDSCSIDNFIVVDLSD